ncbi:MAG: HEAT repeat domain-containing protein [Actinomycetota bacterium]
MTSEEDLAADVAGKGSNPSPGESLLEAALDAFDGGEERARGSAHEDRPIPQTPALLSTSPDQRREALARMMSTGINQGDAQTIARVLLGDPDADTRLMAGEALSRSRIRVPMGVIQRALADPQDKVRAIAARLAARHGPAAFPVLIPLAAQRVWPMAQAAVLEALRRTIEMENHLPGTDLKALLAGVAALDPPPLRAERPGLEGLAQAVGIERLRTYLGGSEVERVGAARLLLAEASPAALRSILGLSEDPSEEVRRAAAAASHLIGHYRLSGRLEPPVGGAGAALGPAARTIETEEPGERDLISSLARALADPEKAVRGQAAVALERLPQGLLADWAAQTLEDGSADSAEKAALVVEHLAVRPAAAALLKRASGMPAEGRAPYLGALTALELSPADMAGLVGSVGQTHRQEAVRLTWQLGGRAVLPFLRPLLGDTAGPVRMAVMEVPGESGDPAAEEVAQELLANDSSAAVRATAVYTLARSDPQTRLAALARALSDPDPDVRATAVEALPSGLAAEMVDMLLPALHDQDERVWQASLRHLAALSDQGLPLLWAALRESPGPKREELVRSIERSDPDRLASLALQNVHARDSTDRVLATELAARAGTPESTAAVVAALSDPDPLVRRTAAAAMSTLRTPSSVGALSRSLSDPQAEVRVEAVRALGMVDDDGVPPVLIAALKDPELRVREMAAEALTRWHSPAVARRLAAALAAPDLRRPAGDVLVRMGTTAVEPLIEVITGDDVEAAAAAGALLERIAGVSAFAEHLSSVDPEERLRAVQVLGAMGGSAAADALLETLSDPDVRIRARSATMLGAMGELRAVKPLRRMFLSDPVSEVAAAAESALRILGTVPQGSGDLRIVDDMAEDVSEPPRE